MHIGCKKLKLLLESTEEDDKTAPINGPQKLGPKSKVDSLLYALELHGNNNAALFEKQLRNISSISKQNFERESSAIDDFRYEEGRIVCNDGDKERLNDGIDINSNKQENQNDISNSSNERLLLRGDDETNEVVGLESCMERDKISKSEEKMIEIEKNYDHLNGDFKIEAHGNLRPMEGDKISIHEEKMLKIEKKCDSIKEDLIREAQVGDDESLTSHPGSDTGSVQPGSEGCHDRISECMKKQMGIIIKKLSFHQQQIESQLKSCETTDLFNSFLTDSAVDDKNLLFNNESEFFNYFTEIAILNGRLDCLQFYFSGKNGSNFENILVDNDTEVTTGKKKKNKKTKDDVNLDEMFSNEDDTEVENGNCGVESVDSDKNNEKKIKNKKIKDDVNLDEVFINEDNNDHNNTITNTKNKNKDKESITNPLKNIEKIPIKNENFTDSPSKTNKQKHLNMRSSSNIRSSVDHVRSSIDQNNTISYNYGYGYNDKGSLFHSTGTGGGKGSLSDSAHTYPVNYNNNLSGQHLHGYPVYAPNISYAQHRNYYQGIYRCKYTLNFIYFSIHICKKIYIHMYICIYTGIYMYMFIYAYIHIHTDI
jgi:hypothetical protein